MRKPTAASLKRHCLKVGGVYHGEFLWPLRPQDELRYKSIKTPPGMLRTTAMTKHKIYVYAVPIVEREETLQTVFMTDAPALKEIA